MDRTLLPGGETQRGLNRRLSTRAADIAQMRGDGAIATDADRPRPAPAPAATPAPTIWPGREPDRLWQSAASDGDRNINATSIGWLRPDPAEAPRPLWFRDGLAPSPAPRPAPVPAPEPAPQPSHEDAAPSLMDEYAHLRRLGYEYRPDSFGRLGQGDWYDERGRKLGESEADADMGKAGSARLAHEAESDTGSDVAPRPFDDGARRVEVDGDNATFAFALPDSETSDRTPAPAPATLRASLEREQARGANARRLVVLAESQPDSKRIEEANDALRFETVRMALEGRRISAADIAALLQAKFRGEADGGGPKRSIRDALWDAAERADGAEGKRHNARLLLALHGEAIREAIRNGHPDPERAADIAVVQFLAADAGEQHWTVGITEDDGAEHDSSNWQLTSDDSAKKPRGSRNSLVRESARFGRYVHQILKLTLDSRFGKRDLSIRQTNKIIGFLDGLLKSEKRFVELKPSSSSGIAAGRRQIERYQNATGKRGRLILYNVDYYRLGGTGLGGLILPKFGGGGGAGPNLK